MVTTGQPCHGISGAELERWRQVAKAKAQAAAIDPAEADWLLQAVSDVDSLSLRLGLASSQKMYSVHLSLDELTALWRQRIEARTPVQYLTGHTLWRDFTLQVSEAVLIPRPETELLIDLAVAAVRDHPAGETLSRGIWVDLGTGSGAIALGLAQAFLEATLYAVDVSEAALAIARHNAQLHGLAHRITFVQGAWFAPLGELQGQIAGLVSNPPYIPTSLLPTLQPEVQFHEPSLALDGGSDGLDSIRILAQAAPDYLCAGGIWLVEMMAGQANSVRDLLIQSGAYEHIQIHRDLAGVERFALGRIIN